jgi:hypothetical protein
MAHKSDQEIIRTAHNTARFFVQNRHIAWVLLVATSLWGVFAYFSMPQRKDPEIPVRQAVAMVSWPGESAERVEQLITTRMEAQIAANRNVTRVESISRTGLAVTYVELGEDTKDTQKEFDDIDFRLNSIHDLPKEASPIRFIKDFGDTSALMLTVASPKVSGPELQLRIRDTREQIEHARSERKSANGMNVVSVVQHFPRNLDPELVRAPFRLFQQQAMQSAVFLDFHFYSGSGFAGTDFLTTLTADQVAAVVEKFKAENLHAAEFHPDAWPTLVIGDLSELESKMTAAAGDKYTYRELEDITETMQKTLQAVPIVSKVERSGILPERVLLTFSQERLATYDLPTNVDQLLGARNTNAAGGEMIIDGRRINIEPSGEFHNEKELGDLMVTMSRSGTPVYLRDLVDITREYQTPSQFLNFYSSRDAHGQWHRNRAITLAVQMRSGEQIGHFGEDVDKALEDLRTSMPADLVISRTSDQPLQVHEQIHLFMNSLMEAVILVVVISWIGLGVAPSAGDGAFHSAHAGNDVWHDARIRDRYPAGFDRIPDHRSGAAGGRSGRRGRCHQAQPGNWTLFVKRRLAGAHETGDRNRVCDADEHRRLPAVHVVDRRSGKIPVFAGNRADLLAGGFAAGLNDIYSAAGVLPVAAEKRSVHG